MEPRRRLVPEEELPPISFSLQKKDLARDEPEQVQRQEPFFKSYFDAGLLKSQQPDLEKKLIVQAKKLEENDVPGYINAKYLKEHHVTLQQLQGKEFEDEESDEMSDGTLNEFWQVEGAELEKEKKEQ